MKIQLITALCLFHFFLASAQSQDMIVLKDSTKLYGSILELVPNSHVKLNTSFSGILNISMDNVDRISMGGVTSAASKNDSKTDSTEVDDKPETVDHSSEIDDRKRERRKEIFFNVLDKTVTLLTDDSTPANSGSSNSEGGTSDQGGQNNAESPSNTEQSALTSTVSTGTACFVNKNFYSRKIILKNASTQEVFSLIVPGNSDGCQYNLPIGTYTYQVYTTFTNKMIANLQLRVHDNLTTEIVLAQDQLN